MIARKHLFTIFSFSKLTVHQKSLSVCFNPKSSFSTEALSAQVNFHPVTRQSRDNQISSSPSLVLFFAYMRAELRHIEKYVHLWNRHGFDVISVRTPFKEFFLPQVASVANSKVVLDFLLDNSSTPYKNILFHGISIGTYGSLTFMEQLEKKISQRARSPSSSPDTQKLSSIKSALRGIIIDSPMYPHYMPVGIAQVVCGGSGAEARARRLLVQTFFSTYYTLLYPFTGRQLARIERAQASNPLRLPGLVLYSANDKMMKGEFSDQLVEQWREKGIPVHSKKWLQSDHVMHFRNYPQEYEEAIRRFFVKQLKLSF